MMTNTPTNYRAWRMLDWGLLIFFAISVLLSTQTLGTRVGRADWTNWLWVACSLLCVVRCWERLFGKRVA